MNLLDITKPNTASCGSACAAKLLLSLSQYGDLEFSLTAATIREVN